MGKGRKPKPYLQPVTYKSETETKNNLGFHY